MTLKDYLDLVTSEHRLQPVFISTLSANLNPSLQIHSLMSSLIDKFDVDLAVGQQLDFIGQWVGVSRLVTVPITGVFFSWDDPDITLGWDSGIWQGGTQVTALPDENYRTIIRGKIAANHWDGTIEGIYTIMQIAIPEILFLIQDAQDMTFKVLVVGPIDALDQALIENGYIPLKPEGVRIRSYLFSPGPVFAWDLVEDNLAGWETGLWVSET